MLPEEHLYSSVNYPSLGLAMVTVIVRFVWQAGLVSLKQH